MKVTLIASVSANGRVLVANNPNHQMPQEIMGFFLQKAIESGNLGFGFSTYSLFINMLKGALKGKLEMEEYWVHKTIYLSSSTNTIANPSLKI